MFFDVRGICWTLAGILVVVLFCALDLHCSNRRDAKAAGAGVGAIAHVKEEVAAGRHEVAVQRRDQRNVMIRDLRVMVRRMLKEGRKEEARRLMAEIQKLEKERSDVAPGGR